MKPETDTRLIFIRHGQTLWNMDGRVMGQLDSPLSPLGEMQAQAIAERLAEVSFDHLYSSDLGRAVQTAGFIAARTGHAIQLEEDLRERHLGVFQGITGEDKRSLHAQTWKACKAGGADYQIPGGGESQNQRRQRASSVMERLAERHPGNTVVIVSHDGILRGFLAHVLGLDIASETLFLRKNASYNCFVKQNDTWRVLVWGDTSHLKDLSQT